MGVWFIIMLYVAILGWLLYTYVCCKNKCDKIWCLKCLCNGTGICGSWC